MELQICSGRGMQARKIQETQKIQEQIIEQLESFSTGLVGGGSMEHVEICSSHRNTSESDIQITQLSEGNKAVDH